MSKQLIEMIKDKTIIVFDLEVDRSFAAKEDGWYKTFEKSRIIQIWAVKIEKWIIVDTMEDYVLPEPWYQITEFVSELTWITDSDIRTRISEEEAIKKFLEFMWEDRSQVVLAWHNQLWYDNIILNNVLDRIKKDPLFDYDLPIENFDILQIARRIYWKKWNANSALAEKLWIDVEECKKELTALTWIDYWNAELHTALYDSYITAKNMMKLIEMKPEYFV